jgi:hypothetical protein
MVMEGTPANKSDGSKSQYKYQGNEESLAHDFAVWMAHFTHCIFLDADTSIFLHVSSM